MELNVKVDDPRKVLNFLAPKPYSGGGLINFEREKERVIRLLEGKMTREDFLNKRLAPGN